MTALAPFDVLGAWVGISLTMAILSFLYGDHPFYKFAEHLLIGVAIGYIIARAQDVRGSFVSPADAAQIHGELAAVVSGVIIVAGIWFWERRIRRTRAGIASPGEAS